MSQSQNEISLPFSTTEEAEAFGRQATPFEIIIVADYRATLACAFLQESDAEVKMIMALEMQLCRECLKEFKKAYRPLFATAERSLERKAA